MPIAAATLTQFRRPVLVETGTFQGNGTQAALDAGFGKVYTIEVYPALYHAACQRFSGDTRVELFLGSSIERLLDILPRINEPATFFLDAHSCGGATGGAWDTPLIGELRLIATHPLSKEHIVLIDDVHLFGLDLPGWAEIQARLANINPTFNLTLVPSADPALGADVLAAVP